MIDIMDKTPAMPAHEIRPEFEYVYHWHRIIPAAASLAIGIGAVLWFWPTSLPSEKAMAIEEAAPVAGGPIKAKTVVVDLPLPTPAATSGADSTIVDSKKETPAQKTSVASSTTTVQLASPVKSAAPALSENITAAATAASQASTAVTQKAAALKAINEAPAPAAGMKPGQVKVIDGSLKSVSLRQMIDHDPLDLNKGSIGLTKQKAVKVMFSANVGKPNQPINYLWYLDGKLKAKVSTRSAGDASTLSSKFISYDAPGLWQVQMTNAEGKVLAESAFSAKRIQ